MKLFRVITIILVSIAIGLVVKALGFPEASIGVAAGTAVGLCGFGKH